MKHPKMPSYVELQGLVLRSIAGFAEIGSQKLRGATSLGVVAVDDDDEVPVLTLLLFLQLLLKETRCRT